METRCAWGWRSGRIYVALVTLLQWRLSVKGRKCGEEKCAFATMGSGIQWGRVRWSAGWGVGGKGSEE